MKLVEYLIDQSDLAAFAGTGIGTGGGSGTLGGSSFGSIYPGLATILCSATPEYGLLCLCESV